MKKVCILLLLMVCLVACEQKSIIGEWNPKDIDSEIATMVITEESIIIMEIPIPYEIKGNTIYIQDSEGTKSFKYKIKKNTLTFTQGEVSEVYIRQENE